MKRLSLVFLFVLACCTPRVDRARWQHMPPSEKTLYVKSLLGAEKVKDAKGGTGHRYSSSPEDYVRKIDEAYARGERREPSAVFAALHD